VRLASQLTRWDIDILTEAEESERRQEEYRRKTGLYVEALDVDDVIAGLLVTEGFTTVEELAYTPPDELADIEGFDESIADELIRRAQAFLDQRNVELTEKRVALGVSDEVASMEVLTPAMLVALGEKGVKSLDDLGDLASDELVEILGADAMDESVANEVIMAARAHWFDGDAAAAPQPDHAAEDEHHADHAP
jgi:N utilization substance protein A